MPAIAAARSDGQPRVAQLWCQDLSHAYGTGASRVVANVGDAGHGAAAATAANTAATGGAPITYGAVCLAAHHSRGINPRGDGGGQGGRAIPATHAAVTRLPCAAMRPVGAMRPVLPARHHRQRRHLLGWADRERIRRATEKRLRVRPATEEGRGRWLVGEDCVSAVLTSLHRVDMRALLCVP